MNEEEIKQRMFQQQMQEQQLQQTLKIISMQILEKKARERLSNLKLVKPQIAMQLELYLAQAYQAGQLQNKITDEQLVSILQKISGGKREFVIKRK
ncbi:MAG TPA: DNA-binding protein [archaeon]|nr:DNA-binding protein [archaeon]